MESLSSVDTSLYPGLIEGFAPKTTMPVPAVEAEKQEAGVYYGGNYKAPTENVDLSNYYTKAEIDALIKKHLDSWDFERINKVDLAVLRISVYPLLYQSDDIHPSIIINEAIDISKEYGPGDTYKFVNAVLDNIRKEISR